MSNLIVTGGYGVSAGNTYADIDWTKTKKEVLFQIAAVNDVKFSIKSNAVTFQIASARDVKFNINTTALNFKIDSYDLKFNTKMCT